MIRATLYKKKNQICAFEISGHAGYAPAGEDIVCAAVTVLTFNTVNAIEAFTDVPFKAEADEKKGGYLKVTFPVEGMQDEKVQLLLQTLQLGLSGIETEYQKYMTLNIEEV